MSSRVKVEEVKWYRGFKYCVTFGDLGHRCGYVAVPPEHPMYKAEYSDYNNGVVALDCHYGVTYTEAGGGTTYPMNQFDPCWWIGFDCAHCDDAKDMDQAKKYFYNQSFNDYLNFTESRCNPFDTHGIVRSRKYVRSSCHELINSLIQHQNEVS